MEHYHASGFAEKGSREQTRLSFQRSRTDGRASEGETDTTYGVPEKIRAGR